MITKNIPIIDNYNNALIDNCFGDDRLNAYQILYLEDNDNGSSLEILTKWLRENGIQGDKVLIDNTW